MRKSVGKLDAIRTEEFIFGFENLPY